MSCRAADFFSAASAFNSSSALIHLTERGELVRGKSVEYVYEAALVIADKLLRGRDGRLVSPDFTVTAPYTALARHVAADPDVSPEGVLELSSELGVSYESLVFRLHNVGLLPGGAAKRDELQAARPMVLTEQLRGRRLERPTVLPPDYVMRALRAYELYEISLDRLAELLYEDETELRADLSASQLLHPEDQ